MVLRVILYLHVNDQVAVEWLSSTGEGDGNGLRVDRRNGKRMGRRRDRLDGIDGGDVTSECGRVRDAVIINVGWGNATLLSDSGRRIPEK
ncbi:hypothetical protein BV898_00967 [Hypsibius exemplaris]|uniref:Uncharacterized protein n=1 Tax=Hypsibius exemplaris TaxID=2072580 RepID=A0A1W0XCR7_HYPEX|nr:hypothetical protein BV898_00967 [Hypsibius exemplaris]